ncbi:MAG: SDR family NAD(P)-dependent oxidoreductase [Lewinellaceae bacterium]|nr:SDR family NAD(P)-dependent oxidoreductase [Saprospiraceae bacterium]MCB9336848.1 SDR family NAD(P)-dependent oxidoreductase [Lewinellaceae bacterium]
MAKSLSTTEKTRLKNHYGPWALVTGASSGIGRELAVQLAAAGLNLVLSARRQDELEHLASDVEKKHGIQTKVVAGDLSVPNTVQRLISETRGLDVGLLVPCAGFGTSGLFEKSNLEAEVNMLRLNCEAVLRLVHHFVPIFQKRKRSGIILMSSIVAFQGVPRSAHYAATKAWVQSLAEGLADELRAHRIDVLSAIPGPVESGFSERANMKMSLSNSPADVGVPILRALGRGSSVVPGGVGKLLVYSLRTVPRWAKVRIMKMVMGGMTAHQRG